MNISPTVSSVTGASSRGVIALLAVALGACGDIKQNDTRDAGQVRTDAKRQQAICASSAAYSRLKTIVFDQAISRYEGDRANLDTLADYSSVRIEAPVVEGRDATLDLIRCQGRFILDVPPGAERAFAGERRLQADIGYTAQPAADGSGMVYRLSGGEPIITRLAAFNLKTVAFRPPPAIDETRADADADETIAVAEAPRPAQKKELAAQPPKPAAEEDRVPIARQERSERVASDVSGRTGEATVRAFYAALGNGDGDTASAQVIPEKRASSAFSPDAITRFYGRLPEPIKLTDIKQTARDAYRVSYRYSAGRSRCNGSAIVSVTNRAGRDLIRSIRALSGC
ncbi:hypothetical protein [Sphingomonas radiodurans]|uniref:hypothetical protein n=1 Tax=Sphingomonas radiodurans TaxID=2890321 RepID=UPI001E2857A8|nr:hypothetical protein [Sphingomonas radiodurans]WBH15137.1 hypothetical protein LLW23_09700 [Sphingomonas radiodurans]